MADAESIRQIAHARTPLSTWLGIVLLFVLFGVIVLALIGPMPRGSDYEETRAKKRMEKLKTVREEADKALDGYAWVDKNKGIVRIPISRAMELTVAELVQKKPAPAGPIATPAATPGSPAPAASAQPGAGQPAASPSPPAPAASPPPAGQKAMSPPPKAPQSASPAAQPSSQAARSPAPSSPAPAKTP